MDEAFSLDDLMTITHVCQRWRSIALKDATLWDIVPFYDSAMVTTLLDRSGNQPIALLSKSTGGPATALLQMVEDTFSLRSLREIHLSHTTPVLENLVAAFMEATSPGLQALSLTSLSPGEAYLLSRRLLRREAPTLQRLSLSGCTPNWRFPMFPTLTSFALSATPAAASPSQSELHQLFTCMPLLEYLSIRNALPNANVQAVFTPEHKVYLKKLQYLDLVGTAEDIEPLQELIRFPPSTKLHITCTDAAKGFGLGPKTKSVLDWVHKTVTSQAQKQICTLRTLALDAMQPNELHVLGYTRAQSGASQSPSSAQLNLNLEWSAPTEASQRRIVADALARTTAAVAAGSLRAAMVSSPAQNASPAPWLAFPGLGIAGARGACAVGLINALATLAAAPGHDRHWESSQAEPAFAELRLVILEDVDFGWRDDDGRRVGRLLVDALRGRETNGAPLDELELRNCEGLDEKLEEELREIVVTLSV